MGAVVKAIPDNAVRIDSRDEAPEGAQIVEGERGGLYYIPPDEEGSEEDGEDAGELPEFDLSSAEVVETVSEPDADVFGGSDHQVDLVDIDGEQYFVRRLDDQEAAERVGTALAGFDALGVPVPDWGVDSDEDAVAMREVEGDDLLDTDMDDVDEDQLADVLARATLAGDTDLQFENILIDEDGTPYPVDPGEAGQELPDDPEEALPAWNQLEDLIGSEDMPVTTEEIWERTAEVAEDIDSDELRESLPDNEAAENIVANLDAAQQRAGVEEDGGGGDGDEDREFSDVEEGETVTIEDDRGNSREVTVEEVSEEGTVWADIGSGDVRRLDPDEWNLAEE